MENKICFEKELSDLSKLLRMKQDALKKHMANVLKDAGYADMIDKDGFLYAKGDAPILFVAHLDTVHKSAPNVISFKDGVVSSKDGIGGDDRCGVYIIQNLLDKKPSVLFCESEEVGGIGANKFASTEYIKKLDVKYIVEFDRRGNKDAVFYNCDSPEFEKFIHETTGYVKNYGTFSDISVIAPRSGIAAVNLSSGYYNEHMTSETISIQDVLNSVEAGKKLIDASVKLDKPFKYVAKKFSYQPSYFSNGYYDRKSNYAPSDLNITVTVYYEDRETGEELFADGEGKTKGDAWFNFFKENSNVCFNDIIDYEYE